MGACHLTVKHARYAPGIAHTLRVISQFRRGDPPPVRWNVLIKCRLSSRRKRSFFSRNIQLSRSWGLAEQERLQLVGSARHITISLELAFTVILTGKIPVVESGC